MSALTLPLVYSLTTIDGVADLVNVELVGAVTKVDIPTMMEKPAEYQIVFKLRGDNTSPNDVTWRYATEAARNTAYGKLLDFAAQDLATVV
jgi:hypothetical protein